MESYTAELLTDAKADLGECPVWDEQGGHLYWLDIPPGTLHRHTAATGENRSTSFGGPIGSFALRRDGGFILAMENGFAQLDAEMRKLTPLFHHVDNFGGSRFNDGKCDPAGRFLAGTMTTGPTDRPGILWSIGFDQNSLCEVKRNVTISNGLAWSADGRTMYYIDTIPRTVSAFDYDAQSGKATRERTLIKVDKALGYPDGMTIDRQGKLWIAHFSGGCVRRWDPDSGEILAEVLVPAAKTTSCTFGGPTLSTLYITTARGYTNDTNDDQQPVAGGLFQCNLPYQGYPMQRFNG